MVETPLQNRDPGGLDPVVVHNVVPSLDAGGLVEVSNVQAVKLHGGVIPLKLGINGGVSCLLIGHTVVLRDLGEDLSEFGALVECNVLVRANSK